MMPRSNTGRASCGCPGWDCAAFTCTFVDCPKDAEKRCTENKKLIAMVAVRSTDETSTRARLPAFCFVVRVAILDTGGRTMGASGCNSTIGVVSYTERVDTAWPSLAALVPKMRGIRENS